MSALTSDFLANRQRIARYKRFILPIGIFLLIAGAVAAGFYFFEKSEETKVVAGSGMQTLPREWLLKYFGVKDENDPRVGGLDGDPDTDILNNRQEFYFGTDPTDPDSDDDGQGDGAEVAVNSNPLGDGELYSTEIAKQIADQFAVYNNMPEFKQENIQVKVLGILSPPKPEDIKVVLEEPRSLKVINNNSPEAVEEYLQKVGDIGADISYSTEALQTIIQNPASSDYQNTLSSIFEIVHRLRELPVPSDWITYHQLQIAAQLTAANILQIEKTLDPAAEVETQSGKIREQYYKVSVIQRIEEMRAAEVVKLYEKYKDTIDKLK